MSLRDELLKAGLASADKAKKLDSDARKQDHQRKKDKALAAEVAARQAEVRRQLEAEAAGKREADRRLNLEREAEKQRREQAIRARQLIDSHRLHVDPVRLNDCQLQSGDTHVIESIRCAVDKAQPHPLTWQEGPIPVACWRFAIHQVGERNC